MLRGLVDAVLETSVVGSFTKVGYEVRRRLYDWQDLAALEPCPLVAADRPLVPREHVERERARPPSLARERQGGVHERGPDAFAREIGAKPEPDLDFDARAAIGLGLRRHQLEEAGKRAGLGVVGREPGRAPPL